MTDNRNIVFLFPGQGSQYRGMGRRMFENNPIFRNALEQCDAMVKKALGRSLIDEIYHSNLSEFDDLLITHPAIVAIELAMVRVMEDLNIRPSLIAGSSLGEFAASATAGVWDAETAIDAAIEQAKCIVRDAAPGGMLVIMDCDGADRRSLLEKHPLALAVPPDYFWNVVSQYASFPELMGFMESKGPCMYVDMGPSGTSANFAKYNLPASSRSGILQVLTPYGRELEQIGHLKKLLQ